MGNDDIQGFLIGVSTVGLFTRMGDLTAIP